MIIFLVIISVLIMLFTFLFGKALWTKIVGIIALAVFIGSLLMITANDKYHLGMENDTQTKTVTLVSSVESQMPVSLLLYQKLGTGDEKIYLYRTDVQQKKPKATQTSKTTNKVVKTTGKPTLTVKTVRRVYKNEFARLMFSISGNDNQFVKRTNTFSVNKTWQVLSTSQAKAMAKAAAQNKSK